MICPNVPENTHAELADALFKLLEEVKAQGGGRVVVQYGETVGIDDMNVEPGERNIRIFWTPSGAAIHSIQAMLSVKLKELVTFTFDKFPTVLSHLDVLALPPDQPGFFIYGDADVIDMYHRHGSIDVRKWKLGNS